MKKILSAILLISVQITVFSQMATLEFINNPTSGNDITFEVFLKPDAGTTIYLGNFDITIALPNGSTVSNAVRTVRANILSEDRMLPVPISTSISSDGIKINYQPSAPGDQSDFNAFIAKITTRVSLGTYKITFINPPSGTVSCGGSSFFKLAPVNPWASTNVPTSCSTVLPLELLDFSVNAINEKGIVKAQIKWKTASEKKMNYYEVEKSNSTNIKDFSTLKKIVARNSDTESYDLIDEKPFPSINYYRLKMVNIDGSVTYSSIKSVVFKDAKNTVFKVYPNPAFNSLTIDYALDLQKETAYTVVNMLGQTLMQGKLTSPDLDISSLPTGAFVIKVGEGQSKFFKQ
jgi:Secretion system C-terminal sorting domain